MKKASGSLKFGPWLPDVPPLDNPGLTEAQNVLWRDGTYKQFKPLASTGMDNLQSQPLGGIVTENYTYIGLANSIERSLTSAGTWTDYSQTSDESYLTANSWRFTRFDDYVIGTNGLDTPQMQTLGSASRFADLQTAGSDATAPAAYVAGTIGRFVMFGFTESANYHVRWSGIGAPRNWPVPGTTTAQSAQSGEQYLRSEWGDVTGIVGGDQFGLIFQEGGITRVSYLGGDEVFQFDELEGSPGCHFRNSIVEAEGKWYYISPAGFAVTDGTTAVNIGDGIVDRYFWDSYLSPTELNVWGAVDENKKLIFWAYQKDAGDTANRIIAYNYKDNRFTHCEQELHCLLSDPEAIPSDDLTFRAFNATFGGRLFTGTVGAAVITTQEAELTPGGYTRLQGVKSFVEGSSPSYTVTYGRRNSQGASVSYGSEATANSRSDYANFRAEARYHRIRLTINGTFNSASGIQVQAEESGAL